MEVRKIRIDLTGHVYGKMTVLNLSEERKRNIPSWNCLCECGVQKVVTGQDLRAGQVSSCGCSQYEGTPKDITGKRNGSLIAIRSTGIKSDNGDYIWEFLCDCGDTCKRTLGNFNFKKGNQTCGDCNRKELLKRAEKRKVHGLSKDHKTYKAWSHIKERCYNKSGKNYETYGARGIVLEECFIDNFLAFYEEVGDAPNDGQRWSIDRIDHTKNYEKGNMRWATDFQQARNKGKMKNNSTNVTGVSWDDKLHPSGKNSTLYAVVQWKEYDSKGNKIWGKKCFSTKKYGIIPAFYEAVKYRKEIIEDLNRKGYGYAENHGE